MKYIKLFMLMLTSTLLFACSDDDDSINSNSVTVGFTSDTITVKENTGYFNVPIAVTGVRNGDIKVTISATGSGENFAEENTNYLITDKTLSLLNDTTNTETMNVEIKTVDDDEINTNREFTLTIASAEGASITKNTVVVVIRDNDAAFYEKFFGKWTLSYVVLGNSGESNETKTITISGPSDESDPNYDKVLDASCPSMFNVGIDLDCSWHFNYTFDSTTKKGTLGVVMGETVASYGSSYQWIFALLDGDNLTLDDYTADWSLDENNAFPTTITFPDSESKAIALYDDGVWRYTYNWVLTKQ
jgi:hypothetical protein